MKTKISKPVDLKELDKETANLKYKYEKAEKLITEAIITLSLMVNETDPDKSQELYNKAEKLTKKLVKLAGYKLIKVK